jgi:formylglycine-generating enzyme required for sulfatase activity
LNALRSRSNRLSGNYVGSVYRRKINQHSRKIKGLSALRVWPKSCSGSRSTDSKTLGDFQSYLDQYPHGAFAVLAKRHLDEQQELQSKTDSAKEGLILSLEAEMMTAHAGTFHMGGYREQGALDSLPWVRAIHPVSVHAFKIMKYDVTVAQWQRYLTASSDPGGSVCGFSLDAPVACVSWQEIQRFVQWLNLSSIHHMKLPTEAE